MTTHEMFKTLRNDERGEHDRTSHENATSIDGISISAVKHPSSLLNLF